MAPWNGPRHRSWASNGNLLNVALVVVGTVWLGFQIYAAAKHDPALRPPALDTALMTVLGAWVTNKAVEQRRSDERTAERVEHLERVAEANHPNAADTDAAGAAPPTSTTTATDEGEADDE